MVTDSQLLHWLSEGKGQPHTKCQHNDQSKVDTAHRHKELCTEEKREVCVCTGKGRGKYMYMLHRVYFRIWAKGGGGMAICNLVGGGA